MCLARAVGARSIRRRLYRILRLHDPSQQDLTMLGSLFKWLEMTGLFTHLRDSAYAYPVLLSLHMVALAFFGGMILVTDLRLLGLGLRSYPVAELVNGFRAPKRIGFALAAVTGVLLFGSKAGQYSH